MAEALILDSEALNALAHAVQCGVLADRARAILQIAHEKHALIRVPAPVLAEVCRGPRYDSAIEHLLRARGIGVIDLTRAIARQAGHLLTKARLSSAHAIDAFVIASSLEFESAVIATGDPKDMQRLAAPFRQLRLFAI